MEETDKSSIVTKGLTNAFMAVASCVVVHAGFDVIAMMGGPNFWGLLVDPLRDFTMSVISPDQVMASAGGAAPLAGAEIASATTIPDGCHSHLNGDVHCGTHDGPSLEW